MAKKTKTITHRNACDRMFSQIIRARGRCEYRTRTAACTATTNLQCAHIISRRYAWTRTDLNNAFCLCAKHHFQMHRNPDDWMDFIVLTIGRHEYQRLKAKALMTVGQKFDWAEERARLKKLQGELVA